VNPYDEGTPEWLLYEIFGDPEVVNDNKIGD
jgi:hypothetical protein